MQLCPAGCNSPPSDSNPLTLTSQSSYFLSDACPRRLLCLALTVVSWWTADSTELPAWSFQASVYWKISFSRIARAYELNMSHSLLFCMHPCWCLWCLCFCWVMVVLFQPVKECHGGKMWEWKEVKLVSDFVGRRSFLFNCNISGRSSSALSTDQSCRLDRLVIKISIPALLAQPVSFSHDVLEQCHRVWFVKYFDLWRHISKPQWVLLLKSK